MSLPLLVIVGADKGGVGKTTVSRALLDYFRSHSKDYRAFDTECPIGVLKRFHPATTEIVDLTTSDGQMQVFDNIGHSTITVIDVRAGLLSPTLKTLAEIGFLDMVQEGKIKIVVLHVLGSSIASLNEIRTAAELIQGAEHFLVKNHTNGAMFFDGMDGMAKEMLAGINQTVLEIPKLDERATEFVEEAGKSFIDFTGDESQSATLRGKVKHWLSNVFKQFDQTKLY